MFPTNLSAHSQSRPFANRVGNPTLRWGASAHLEKSAVRIPRLPLRNSRVRYRLICRLASISIKTSALRARFAVQFWATTFGWHAHAEYLWPFPLKVALELFLASAGATGVTQELGILMLAGGYYITCLHLLVFQTSSNICLIFDLKR